MPCFTRIALVVAAVCTAGFGIIAWQVAAGQLPEVDHTVAVVMKDAAADQPWLRQVMIVATLMGSVPAMAALAVAGAAWQWRRGARQLAVGWICIVSGGGLATLGMKMFFDRERPPAEGRDPYVHETNESFPSGHSMGGLIGYGMLAFALMQSVRRPGCRVALLSATASWIGLIGFSRIYLRAHWLSDVLAGWLIGAAWLALGLALMQWRQREKEPRTQ